MKKWISILLLSFYLVSTTELYQLLKIPTLVEHFIEHNGDNPEITLISFLKMHYDDPVKDDDYQKDQQLPFIAHSCPLALLFTLNADFTVEIEKQIILDYHKEINSFYDLFYDKDASNSIWQPPKNC